MERLWALINLPDTEMSSTWDPKYFLSLKNSLNGYVNIKNVRNQSDFFEIAGRVFDRIQDNCFFDLNKIL